MPEEWARMMSLYRKPSPRGEGAERSEADRVLAG